MGRGGSYSPKPEDLALPVFLHILWAGLQGDIIHVHGGHTARAIVERAPLQVDLITLIGAQIELHIGPGLAVAALPDQRIDPVLVLVEDEQVLSIGAQDRLTERLAGWGDQ